MSEIKTKLFKLNEGQSYIAGREDYVITEQHTLTDILRHLVMEGGKEELVYLLKHLEE